MSYFITNTGKKVHHNEGDVWEESGKTWTIKNGVKKTLGKLDIFRKNAVMPLACPCCNKAMKSSLDSPIWSVYKRCFNCMIDLEHEIAKKGKWEDYQTTLIKANMESRFTDLEAFVNEFIKDDSTKGHVTENGKIEDWIDNSKNNAQVIGDNLLKDYKTQIEKV
jgi:hypothetical protein